MVQHLGSLHLYDHLSCEVTPSFPLPRRRLKDIVLISGEGEPSSGKPSGLTVCRKESRDVTGGLLNLVQRVELYFVNMTGLAIASC